MKVTNTKNISASFTAPGQSVTYSLYVYNAGQLQAQLTGITFNNATHATGTETYKHCSASDVSSPNTPATDSLVASACEGISISVSIGTAEDVTPSSLDKTLNYQLINAGSSLEATVTIYPTKQVLGSQIVYETFGYDSNANCTNSIKNDYSTNSCITWVNG